MTHPIPIAALDDRLAILGTAGAGKTYAALGAEEILLARKSRVIHIDPLGVAWGLRLQADGKTASAFEVVIFGGAHGDLPITEHSGAVIGETVATMRESCIVDLSQLGTKAAERRFMLAFLTALYRATHATSVHLVIDEADMFAPQKLLDKDGDAAKLLGMMETVIRRGRVKGFIPWLITQRPAVLSKDVLSQADGLIALKLTSSQDRDAIGAWIEGQADRQDGKAILASLPTMQRGQGVVWIPGRNILKTSEFPLRATFDSSRAPKRGEVVNAVDLRPIDLGGLRSRLAVVEAEAKANDPRALKAEIATLKRQAAVSTKPVVDQAEIERAEQRGYARGLADGNRAGIDALRQVKELADMAAAMLKQHPPVTVSARTSKPLLAPRVTTRPRSTNGHADGLTNPQRRILASVGFWRSIDEDRPTREQVAAAAGYKPGSGGFNNLIGGLVSAGHLAIPMSGCVSLTEHAPYADLDEHEAREKMLSVLTGPQRKIVEAAAAYRDGASREQIAEDTEYAPGSGGFNNLIGSLCSIAVLTKPSSGHVALSDWAREILYP